MPSRFYVDNYDQLTEKERNKLRTKYVCPECGEWVNYWVQFGSPTTVKRIYLACNRHNINKHEGVAKEFTPPSEIMNIARRESMSEHEVNTSQALTVKGVPLSGLINKEQATTILTTIWKKAPAIEVYKAAMLCQDYGLHPLMKHVYLICYNEGKQNESWVTVLGIGATRLMMARQGTFSYTDDTPRIMSDKEQMRIFGKVDTGNIVAITKLRTKDGLEANGYGKYPRTGGYLMGEDKGNSRENMAFIRSERNAFGRLFPDASMPKDIEVIDEQYMDTPSGKVNTSTGELEETKEDIVNGDFTPVENELWGALQSSGKPVKEEAEEPVKDKRGELEKQGTDLVSEAKKLGAEVIEEPVQPELKAPVKAPVKVKGDKASDAEIAELHAQMKRTRYDMRDLGAFMNIEKKWGIDHLTMLTSSQVAEVIEMLKKM